MVKNVTYGFVLLAAIFFSNGIAFAEDSPSIDQVYKAAQAGRLEDAQRMMDKVLKEHPNSAKAHFVAAEVFARQGQMAKADSELNNAEHLKPDLSFANPQAVQDLKNRIAVTHRVSQLPASSFQPAAGNSFPWGMLFLVAGVIAIIFFIWRAMNSRKSATYPDNYQPGNYRQGAQNAPPSPAPMQPYGGGMAPAGGGMGSGIMGGLVTGAAVGVGMVAGEALAHRLMDGGHSAPPNVAADTWGSSSNDMGGSDFGIADNSSWDDNSGVADNSSDVSGSDWG